MKTRSYYRKYIGWLWKILGRCRHCSSKNVKSWNDSEMKIMVFGHHGKLCNDCNYVTLD